mmetsp:Transcript_54155/g.166631  ORF Transcript_54155/g.166631 Transcript_54155/m.166631 type:complete len:257 (+) Transcript_54155:66-836(+)
MGDTAPAASRAAGLNSDQTPRFTPSTHVRPRGLRCKRPPAPSAPGPAPSPRARRPGRRPGGAVRPRPPPHPSQFRRGRSRERPRPSSTTMSPTWALPPSRPLQPAISLRATSGTTGRWMPEAYTSAVPAGAGAEPPAVPDASPSAARSARRSGSPATRRGVAVSPPPGTAGHPAGIGHASTRTGGTSPSPRAPSPATTPPGKPRWRPSRRLGTPAASWTAASGPRRRARTCATTAPEASAGRSARPPSVVPARSVD